MKEHPSPSLPPASTPPPPTTKGPERSTSCSSSFVEACPAARPGPRFRPARLSPAVRRCPLAHNHLNDLHGIYFGVEPFVLGSNRGQAAVNNFAVLNACQQIKTVRTLLVNGAEYMFFDVMRTEPADGDIVSSYTLQRTTVIRVESDLDAIVAGLLWRRDGVRSNAALAKNASESQGADQAEDGGMVEQGPFQGGGQGSQGSGKSGAENPGQDGGPRATENKSQGGTAPTRRALQDHDDPPLLEKLNLLGFVG